MAFDGIFRRALAAELGRVAALTASVGGRVQKGCLYEILEQCERRSYPDPIGRLIILATGGADLPSLDRRKLRAEVSEAAIHIRTQPLALNSLDGSAVFRDGEIDLAVVETAKIAQVQGPACGVLLEVNPL